MIKRDKIQHFIAGFVVSVFMGLPIYFETQNLFAGIWASLFSGLLVGGVKEWCDNLYATWNWKDLLATGIGSLCLTIFIILAHFAKG